MKATVAAAKGHYEKAEQAAQETWKSFQDAKAEAEEKHGPEFVNDPEIFDPIHELSTKAHEAKEQASQAKDGYINVLSMEGQSAPEEFKKEGDPAPKVDRPDLYQLASMTLGEKMADAMIADEGYKAIQQAILAQPDSARVELPPIAATSRDELKSLLWGGSGFKALVSGAGATTGDVVIVNDRQAGVVELPRNPRAVLPLVGRGSTDSDTVEWVEFTSRTNNAAERAEATTVSDSAADAPESGFVLTLRNTTVREIKHFIPATRIGLADAGQLRTTIDQELLEGLQDRLELQILAGNGTAPNLRGILNTSGIQTQAKGADSNADAVYKAITKILVSNFTPDGIVMNPNDWALIRLQKDANQNYQFGGPQVGDDFNVWGYPVRLSANLSAGTALVGNFARGATLWLRQGAAISATDSHSDWFIRGVIAILASMRAAFGVPRPLAFCTVTGIA